MGMADQAYERAACRHRVHRLRDIHEILEPQGVPQGPVHERTTVHRGGQRPAAQRIQLGETELVPRPQDRGFRRFVEPADVQLADAGRVVVAGHHRRLARREAAEARAGVGSIADHVAQAKVLVDPLASEGVHDGRQRFKIAVDVGEDCIPHAKRQLVGS